MDNLFIAYYNRVTLIKYTISETGIDLDVG